MIAKYCSILRAYLDFHRVKRIEENLYITLLFVYKRLFKGTVKKNERGYRLIPKQFRS